MSAQPVLEAQPEKAGVRLGAELPTGGAKRPFIQQLFTRIAPRYDLFNRLASCGLDQLWRRKAVRKAGVSPGMRVLDVCAGTGDLSLLCAQRVGHEGSVIGLDMNPDMLDHAARKSASRRVPIGWLQGDALALPLPTSSVDRVFVGFSTRNLSDLNAGLREMIRVLRPGGQLVILETGRPANPIFRALYWVFLFTGARVIGWILTGELWPFTYLARSAKQFLTPEQMLSNLRSTGARAEYAALSGGLASLYTATKP